MATCSTLPPPPTPDVNISRSRFHVPSLHHHPVGMFKFKSFHRKPKQDSHSDASNPKTDSSRQPARSLTHPFITAHRPPSDLTAHIDDEAHASTPSVKKSKDGLSSRRAKTALNALLLSIEVLGQAPLPGIDLITTALKETISRVKAVSANNEGFLELAKRMDCLGGLLKNVDEDARRDENISKSAHRLIEELAKLNKDIKSASNRRSISKFFDHDDMSSEVEGHSATLDSIIGDFSAAIGVNTNSNVKLLLKRMKREEPAEFLQRYDFNNATIDTSRADGNGGGHVASQNEGSVSMIFSGANMNTGGGHVGVGNDARVQFV